MPREEKGREFIPIGKIVGAHGIRGRVKLLYFSRLKAFPYSEIYLQEPTGRYRSLRVLSSIPLKGVLALEVEGIHTRTAALSLSGRLVFCPRESFPATEPDEFYWNDLIGMEVISPDVPDPGRITGVIETGATDILEIEISGKNILIPFAYHWLEEILPTEGRIVLKPGALEFFDVH